jgi:hypothetical protein
MATSRSGKSLTDAENERLRVVIREKLLPLYNGNQSTAGPAIGLTQSAISRLLSGGGGSLETAKNLSALLGLPLSDVLGWPTNASDQPPTPAFGDLPGWREAEAEARRRFGDLIPGFAFDRAARTMGGAPPAVISASTVAGLAKFWLESSSREDRIAAERDEILAKKAEEDAERPSETRPSSTIPVSPKRTRRGGG